MAKPIEEGDYVRLWASNKKGDSFLIRLAKGGSLGSRMGAVRHDDVLAAGFGGEVLSTKGERFFVVRPTVSDFCRKIHRVTQVVYPKDAGVLITSLDIRPGASVLECGSGSGGMTVFFAHFVGSEGRVYSYDVREDHQKVAMDNCRRWGVDDRVLFRVADVEETGFQERDLDALFLDVRCPWKIVDSAVSALAPGGRLAVLVPTVNQVEMVLESLREAGCADLVVTETSQRNWKTNPKRLRPEDSMVAHTGFMVFASTLKEGVAPDEYW